MGTRGRFWQHVVRDDAGAAMVEYSLLLGLIAGAALISIVGAGTQLAAQWQQASVAISGASFGGPPAGSGGSGGAGGTGGNYGNNGNGNGGGGGNSGSGNGGSGNNGNGNAGSGNNGNGGGKNK
ncbi:hypothetical protein DC522_01375 [Microvirga sp. KLBC 81]|uniref:Flp family type IVb pilin n=1 Tax=Microvirga sp. KLBC 81 TaxID=1862707 RepID=UPI000D524955|nr:hypothetical protein [Microvirga sp. KLBC 81]PVE26442.1 hypothetical protein DC522_01375 [Microvirga sp. KLBC 81]